MIEFFATQGGEWELRAQLRSDAKEMPIENAAKDVARGGQPLLSPSPASPAKPQTAWSEARSEAVDDHMMFSPWHGLAAHRPLGGVMRVRKAAYEAGRQFRAEAQRQDHRGADPGGAADLSQPSPFARRLQVAPRRNGRADASRPHASAGRSSASSKGSLGFSVGLKAGFIGGTR